MGNRHAMVVDDDADIRELVAELLAQAGFAVSMARTGLHAIELLAAAPAPHLMLVDLMMPELTGFELVQRLRSFPRFAATPVVAMSAAERHLPAGAGFDGFLRKPFDLQELTNTVEAALRGRRKAG